MSNGDTTRFDAIDDELKRIQEAIKYAKSEGLFGQEIREYRAYLEAHLTRVLYFLAILGAIIGALIGKSIIEFNEIVSTRVAAKTEAELLAIQEKLQGGLATSIGNSVSLEVSKITKKNTEESVKEIKAVIDNENREAKNKVEAFVTTTLNPRIDDALKRLDELGPDDLSSKLIELARIPPGTIVAYWGGGAPGGWLLCNGEPVPEGEVYDDLRLILDDEKLPDLRGVFLRGLDLGRGLDQERVLGSFQDDAFKSHDHGLEDKTEVMDHKDQGMRFQMHGSGSGGMGPNRTRIAGSEVETRPKNVAVSFIIKI